MEALVKADRYIEFQYRPQVMTFELNPDEQELKAALREFFATECGADYRKAILEGSSDFSSKLEGSFAQLNLFSLYSEESTASLRTLQLISEEVGRTLCAVPIADELLCGPVLFDKLTLNKSGKKLCKKLPNWLPVNGLLSGELRAGAIPPAGLKGQALSLDRRRHVLSAECNFVDDASRYAFLILKLPEKSSLGGQWVVVDLNSAGKKQLKIKKQESLDLLRSSYSVKLTKVSYLPLADFLPEGRASIFESTLRVLRAAELSGIAEKVREFTLEYLKTRTQFGVPVGGFQAVQQQFVDAYVRVEAFTALTRFAAWCLDHSPQQLELASRTALSFGPVVVPSFIETALQLHGGIGFTWEYDLHHYLRRARRIGLLWSDADSDSQAILSLAAR